MLTAIIEPTNLGEISSSSTPSPYSADEIANWDGAVERYNSIINSNAEARVKLMSDDDLRRYSAMFNTASASPEDVLTHMFRWGGFRDLLISGGLDGRSSSLFTRLLQGKEPLPFAPPRYFGKSWYALFDQPNALFESTVTIKGRSTRKRDAGRSVWVLLINDCPWECCEMTLAARRLVEIDQQWLTATPQAKGDLWLELRSLYLQDIELYVNYGHWKGICTLSLESKIPHVNLGENLAQLPQPQTESVFGFPHGVDGFPLRWILTR